MINVEAKMELRALLKLGKAAGRGVGEKEGMIEKRDCSSERKVRLSHMAER